MKPTCFVNLKSLVTNVFFIWIVHICYGSTAVINILESDVYICRILTSKVGPRTERVIGDKVSWCVGKMTELSRNNERLCVNLTARFMWNFQLKWIGRCYVCSDLIRLYIQCRLFGDPIMTYLSTGWQSINVDVGKWKYLIILRIISSFSFHWLHI